MSVESLSFALDQIVFVETKPSPKNASRATQLAALLLVLLTPFAELRVTPCARYRTCSGKEKLG